MSLKIFSCSFISFFFILNIQINATTYEVGPGRAYTKIIDVPTHDLQAGDTVKVFAKSAPYFEKLLLHGIGTVSNPVVFLGIPVSIGNKPILDGTYAESSLAINYWNEDRQIIKVGQFASHLSDYVIVDGFVLRNANGNLEFINDLGDTTAYIDNACGIRPEYASHVTIRNCEIYNCGNGLQSGNGEPQNLIIENCYIHDNGASGFTAFEHNIYLISGHPESKATVQFCRFGELQNDGQQIKSRFETTILRYNWIEGGRNSQLDLVESADNGIADAFVYGNVIIKPADTHNGRMIHFGQDGGNPRVGTLHFYNNTCILKAVTASGSLFQVSSDSVAVLVNNNIFYKSSQSNFDVFSGLPSLSGSDNWFSDGISGNSVFQNSISGEDPGFIDSLNEDFHLTDSSVCVDVVQNFTHPLGHSLNFQYVEY